MQLRDPPSVDEGRVRNSPLASLSAYLQVNDTFFLNPAHRHHTTFSPLIRATRRRPTFLLDTNLGNKAEGPPPRPATARAREHEQAALTAHTPTDSCTATLLRFVTTGTKLDVARGPIRGESRDGEAAGIAEAAAGAEILACVLLFVSKTSSKLRRSPPARATRGEHTLRARPCTPSMHPRVRIHTHGTGPRRTEPHHTAQHRTSPHAASRPYTPGTCTHTRQ